MAIAKSKLPDFIARLATGLSANLLGKIWTTLIQLISIPILSARWGAEGFGHWIMLSTVPTYIALSAGGFCVAAAVAMIRENANGNYHNSLEILQSIWVLISVTSLSSALFVSIAVTIIGFNGISHGGSPDLYIAAAILALYSAAALQTAVLEATFRSTKRYALGTIALDIIALTEGIAVLIVAICGLKILAAACTMLALRIFGTILYYKLARRGSPWIQLGRSHATKRTMKALFSPAFASFTYTAAQALSLQGVVLGLGLFAGPATAAIFATARTVCRIPLQLSEIINRAVLPEIAMASAQRNETRAKKLLLVAVVMTSSITIPSAIVLSIFGSRIAHLATAKIITFPPSLFVSLSWAALFQGLWSTLSQPLIAQNRQHLVGYPYLGFAVLASAGTFFASRTSSPVTTMGIISLLVEAACLATIIALARVNAAFVNKA